MPDLSCPNCRAKMTDAEIAHGWCESCGGKIPVFAYKEAGIEVPQPAEPERETPAPRPLTFQEEMIRSKGQSFLFGILFAVYFGIGYLLGLDKATVYLSLIPLGLIVVLYFFIRSLFRKPRKK